MVRKSIIVSLLLLNSVVIYADTQRREPSLFLEYERELKRTTDSASLETNPFKRVLAPITPVKPASAIMVKSDTLPVPAKQIADVKPEIGNDALPYLIVNKSVSTPTPVTCPEPTASNTVDNGDSKSKKSLYSNLRSVKARVLAKAKEYLGTSYGFGNKTSLQTDCSGFTQQVYSQFGISLPHSAAEQAQYGETVDTNDLQVGDLLFYHTYKDEPSHVAIYAGDNQIIHASYKNRRVQFDNIDKGYYKQRFMYAKRLALNSDTSNE